MYKKGQVGMYIVLLAVLVIAGVAVMVGYGYAKDKEWIGDSESLALVGAGEGDPLGTQCTGGETQSLLIKGVNTETGAASTDKFSYRIKGVGDSWTEGTLGTAITAGIQVGADYEFVPGISPTSETGDAYGAYFTIKNMPCQKIQVIDIDDDTLHSDMTGTFYNSDDNAAAQDADADASADWVSIKWQAASNEFAGNRYMGVEYPNVVCMNLNTTTHDTPEAMFNGVDMDRVSAPTVHSAAAGKTTFCFEAPVFDETPKKYFIKIDPDDTNYASLDHDETASLYSGSYYIHSKTADLETGVETDDGNFVGFTAAETVTLDFT